MKRERKREGRGEERGGEERGGAANKHTAEQHTNTEAETSGRGTMANTHKDKT